MSNGSGFSKRNRKHNKNAAASGSETARIKSLRLQKRIFRSLKTEIDRLLGGTPSSIRQYEKEFRDDFKNLGANFGRKTAEFKKSDLIQRIREADVTFIADFHTFRQAQKTAVRIIRESVLPGEQWLIGLECISSQYQEELDAFQKGRISLEKFHNVIRYNEEWGFPWDNYAPVFEWARESGVRLIALNRPRHLLRLTDGVHEVAELYERDKWAAGIIADMFSNKCVRRGRLSGRNSLGLGQIGKMRMIVLYGELHVATQHLPLAVRRVSKPYLGHMLKPLTIHQNYDSLYWRLAERGREMHAEVIQLGRDSYCVLSSTPWAKLQSVVNWIEGEHDFTDDYMSGDYLSLIKAYGNMLADFFGVKAASYENLTVKTIGEPEFVDDLAGYFSKDDLRLIRFHVVHNQRIYIPSAEIAYLGTASSNSAAELAALHLLRLRWRSDVKHVFRQELEDMFRLQLEAVFGFLGSLILNPRRKCDLVADHLRRIKAMESGEHAAFALEKQARQLALNILAMKTNGKHQMIQVKKALKRRSMAPALMIAARYCGQILAKRLHKAMLSEDVEVAHVSKLFFEGGVFSERYLQLLRLISTASIAPSKTENF
ncbi:MAG: ChaN family lipoprotein [Bdellovibrionota bacterium]